MTNGPRRPRTRRPASTPRPRALERGTRGRHRRGWPPFDAPDFAAGSAVHVDSARPSVRRSAPAGAPRGGRPCRDPRAPGREAIARVPDHPGARAPQQRRLAGEPRVVYPTLQQLEDEGLVRAVEADGGRRVFELTDTGAKRHASLQPVRRRGPRRPAPLAATIAISATRPFSSSRPSGRSAAPVTRRTSPRRGRSFTRLAASSICSSREASRPPRRPRTDDRHVSPGSPTIGP